MGKESKEDYYTERFKTMFGIESNKENNSKLEKFYGIIINIAFVWMVFAIFLYIFSFMM